MAGEPVRISSGVAALSATLYRANPAEPGRGCALLAMHSLAEERKGCVRPLYATVQRLALAGWTSLLFDYAGTGDSPGDFVGVTRASLREDCHGVLDYLLHETRADRVCLLAVRLGARLALELAAERAEMIERICLWEPVLDGGRWLKELQRRSRFRHGAGSLDGLDLDGYVFSEELAAALDRMGADLPRVSCPVHILTVGHRSSPTAAMERMAAGLGASIQALELPPFWLATDMVKADALLETTVAALCG